MFNMMAVKAEKPFNTQLTIIDEWSGLASFFIQLEL